MANQSPIVLLILDGWGYREESQYNAIAKAHTPQWDQWWQTCPHVMLDASGTQVGLPMGQMGNSEVGHMHIGAGRVIQQDFTRINEAIEFGEFANNPVFHSLIEDLKRRRKALHILGLLSPGGVHSHESHLFAFLDICDQLQFSNVCLHLFLDGRDTPPQSAASSLEKLDDYLKYKPVAKICSISGRYYAMDRDKRWERLEPVYRLLTENKSQYHFHTAKQALEFFYQQHIHDEFIPPSIIGDGYAIQPNDSVLFFNYRADRARQLTESLIMDDFQGFKRNVKPRISKFVSMTRYAKNLPTINAFPPPELNNTLGEILAKHGLRQLRIAETEKYAHVTFFLNGGSEQVYPNEHRVLIPSPQVKTYDLQPEMSAPEVTQNIINAIENNAYDIIICNFANADMVGHTGNFSAAVKAIESLDQCMSHIWQALAKKSGKMLITADHGNAEIMFDDTIQQAQTAHTNEPVPFLFVGGGWHFNQQYGSLIDVAPTLLTLLSIKPPTEMTGTALLVPDHGK